MPELVIPALQWESGFRAALGEAWNLEQVVPWDPAHDASSEDMAQAIALMALGIWQPGSTHDSQRLRWWVDDDDYLGRISLRHREFRERDPIRYAGHGDIGYDVRPSVRGSGVATEMLGAMLRIAAALEYPDLLITRDETNIASQRVVEKCGGQFLDEYLDGNERLRRYWFAGVPAAASTAIRPA